MIMKKTIAEIFKEFNNEVSEMLDKWEQEMQEKVDNSFKNILP